jgi:hypothetical protein
LFAVIQQIRKTGEETIPAWKAGNRLEESGWMLAGDPVFL